MLYYHTILKPTAPPNCRRQRPWFAVNSMSIGKLVFCAPLSSEPPTRSIMEARLRNIGLIGDPYRRRENSYLVGNNFLQLITFLGCSPNLRLAPASEDDDHFCHVRFIGPLPRPRLLYGRNTRPPRCPRCEQRVEQWRADLENGGRHIDCRHCGEKIAIDAPDWRRNAGAGRFFVQITEVFPGEAVPLPALMAQLRAEGDDWDYFYLLQD